MDWLQHPNDHCHSPADHQLYDRLLAVQQAIQANDHRARQKAHNRLMTHITNCPWGQKIFAIARSSPDYAEALDRLWPWLFGHNKNGIPRLQTFNPTPNPDRGLQRNFEIWLNNKLKYLLQDVYRDRSKHQHLSLDVEDPACQIPEPPDLQPLPWERLETEEDRSQAQAFIAYCASQPAALDITFGQKRTRDRGLTCNRYLALTVFSETKYTQAQLGEEFGLSIDTVNDLVKKFRKLLLEIYASFKEQLVCAG